MNLTEHIASLVADAIPYDIKLRIQNDNRSDVYLHLESRDGQRVVVNIKETR